MVMTNNASIVPGTAWEQGNIVSIAMNLFNKRQLLALCCFPVLLSLSGCGEPGPECGSLEVRSSVVKTVADNRNNPLVNFAIENSSSVAEMVSHANSEAEKSAVKERVKQGAIYALDENIAVNSRSRRATTCTGLLGVSVGDTSAQKELEFEVEQTADGKLFVSVKPFLF
jgi:hypothetical protein